MKKGIRKLFRKREAENEILKSEVLLLHFFLVLFFRSQLSETPSLAHTMRAFSVYALLLMLAAASLLSAPGVLSSRCGGKSAKDAVKNVDDDTSSSSTTSSSPSLLSNLFASKKQHHHHHRHHHDRKPQSPPWFCHDLQCPRYKLLNESAGYETRRLKATRWVTIDVEAFSLALATTTGFQRLFAYISGANEEQKKIEMTAPVLTHVDPGAGPFCKSKYSVSFFVGEEGTPTPKPTSVDVYVRDASAVTVFVASRTGFVVDDYSVAAMASGLRDALERDGVEPHPRHRSEEGFFVAGYDPPFRLSGRHTEVWMAASENDDEDGNVYTS